MESHSFSWPLQTLFCRNNYDLEASSALSLWKGRKVCSCTGEHTYYHYGCSTCNDHTLFDGLWWPLRHYIFIFGNSSTAQILPMLMSFQTNSLWLNYLVTWCYANSCGWHLQRWKWAAKKRAREQINFSSEEASHSCWQNIGISVWCWPRKPTSIN